jgi:transcriptional antiterminator RfaH
MSNWLALYSKPKMERRVADFLAKKGVETYLPAILQYSSHTRREESAPFFPCYLFARILPQTSDFVSLQYTPGLRSVVRFDGRLAWVPEAVITDMQVCLQRLEGAGYFKPKHSFMPGDLVCITSGPLSGREGIFDRNLSKDGRVRILLDFLGHLSACEVTWEVLAKAS